MNTNDIKFLPIDLVDKELTIKAPYLVKVLAYLQEKKIEHTYIEEQAVIPTLDIEDKDLENIIKMIKEFRNENLQKGIIKNYL